MRRRTLGPTGARVPVIGQGTWNMERDDRNAAVAALRRGLDLGLTHVDPDEIRRIDEAFPRGKPKDELPTL